MGTNFTEVYNRFLGKITDDMYMELTPEDTLKDLQGLLIDAIPGFEFPRQVLSYTLDTITKSNNEIQNNDIVIGDIGEGLKLVENSQFTNTLTSEEINILALLMVCGWLQRQITSIENTRMKYSGTDFKFTSQANHLAKLLASLEEQQRQSFHMQRLYKRRRVDENGQIHSNWSSINKSAIKD